jgi:hypothetical protein
MLDVSLSSPIDRPFSVQTPLIGLRSLPKRSSRLDRPSPARDIESRMCGRVSLPAGEVAALAGAGIGSVGCGARYAKSLPRQVRGKRAVTSRIARSRRAHRDENKIAARSSNVKMIENVLGSTLILCRRGDILPMPAHSRSLVMLPPYAQNDLSAG